MMLSPLLPLKLIIKQFATQQALIESCFVSFCFISAGENIIASYNDDDIYRMDTVEHARPHRMEYSLSDPSTPFVPDLYNRCTPLTSAAKADLRSKELAAIFKG